MTEKPGYEELQQRVQELEAITAKQLNRESTLEKLFNLSLDMLCVANTDGYFQLVNAAFETTLGYSMQELLDTPYLEFVHPDDKTATLEAAQQLLAGEPLICFENRYRCKDGAYKWLEWTCTPVTDGGLLYAVARDISAHNALQQALASQHDLLDNILTNVPASIFWKDRNSVYLGVNNRFARDTGCQDPQEIIGKTDHELAWTREQADFYRACDRQVMDSGKAMLNIEESQRQADGKEIHLLTSKVPLLDAAGHVSGMLGIYVDISKLKQAENTLRKSEARLQTLFDSAAEFIFVIDPEGVIINVNRLCLRTIRVYGRRGCSEIISGTSLPRHQRIFLIAIFPNSGSVAMTVRRSNLLARMDTSSRWSVQRQRYLMNRVSSAPF